MYRLTNKEVSEFLEYAKTKSKIVFLEEGKEKNDLLKSAEKRGIIVKNSRDLAILKTIYCFTDKPNANGVLLPTKTFLKALPQIVGKPMNVNHERTFIVGYYIDYKFIAKEKKAIAYAIFFKSAFPKLYNKAKKFKKDDKLSSSFEIWCPKKNKVYIGNGIYELRRQEIAGGALIFEEKGIKPAFEDAKALEISKKTLTNCIEEQCLEYASKYEERDILVESSATKETKTDSIKDVVCDNCKETTKINMNNTPATFKCPSCQAIIDTNGAMINPPQIVDFNLSCLNCNSKNWNVLERGEKEYIIKCNSCSKKYEVELTETSKINSLASELTFLYSRRIHCPQCRKSINHYGSSNSSKINLKCKKCGLNFELPIRKEIDKFKVVKSIKEIEDEDKQEGGKEMAKQKEKANKKPLDIEYESNFVERSINTNSSYIPADIAFENTRGTGSDDNKIIDVTLKEKSKKQKSSEDKKKEEYKEAIKKVAEIMKKKEDEVLKALESIKKEKTTYYKSGLARKALKKQKKLEKASVEKEEVLKKAVRKAVKDRIKIEEALKDKVEFYKANSSKLANRKRELGDFAENYSDEELLNDSVYEIAKIKKENKELKEKLGMKKEDSEEDIEKASEKEDIIAKKNDNSDKYAEKRKAVDELAFPKTDK